MSLYVGLLSDTHGYVHPRLGEVFQGVDFLLHAGDVGRPEVLWELESIAPVRAVWGNVDDWTLRRMLPEWLEETWEGVHLLMTHIGGVPPRWPQGIRDRLERTQPDVFICGHSHVPYAGRWGRTLVLNPGACGREGPHQKLTVMRFRLQEGRLRDLELVELEERTRTLA
ncbi:MAG: metallophosphoesterase family protein [Bacteroidota bacterium]|nr:metallophosphatase family protein [Rhodothermia bacterium]MCS7154813.1 metallophosphatase family protein [Bacteroidota bacterium]MDW8137606.1 metallophosphoesterase family protein [Bacteroidota bacterium]MDW8285440.1 metallophosphoesterase family protein [Bacteroidota bacterium]